MGDPGKLDKVERKEKRGTIGGYEDGGISFFVRSHI
jgi:hypothetical protein